MTTGVIFLDIFGLMVRHRILFQLKRKCVVAQKEGWKHCSNGVGHIIAASTRQLQTRTVACSVQALSETASTRSVCLSVSLSRNTCIKPESLNSLTPSIIYPCLWYNRTIRRFGYSSANESPGSTTNTSQRQHVTPPLVVQENAVYLNGQSYWFALSPAVLIEVQSDSVAIRHCSLAAVLGTMAEA